MMRVPSHLEDGKDERKKNIYAFIMEDGQIEVGGREGGEYDITS